ncbi:MAG: ATP-binding cassette domain-containing protein [Spirochaetes bacterium]|uniref:ATP-binding cassette domain-containing protein n=1 Tax=Candidatus Aphodenecus pullistercoris TaxID=2840669 RepID=A0A9D9E8N0_9SPIR|nr:ATP-binding cassette domain-containing protein [Candidatus Aphodenecus pullistercoris]
MLALHDIHWSTPEGVPILKGLDLEIGDRGLAVITGPNGGGKTTLAKLVAGLIHPDSGRILLDGEDITDLDVTERARKGISYAFQQPVRFKGLTVRDLLCLGSGRQLDEKDVCSLLSKVGLCAKDYKDREVNASLSGGEIKRIEIASVLARQSRLVIFDEPEAGIDLWSFNGLIEAFEEMKRSHDASEVIISHQERILAVADRIIVVEGGKVVKDGPREEVLPTLATISPCPMGRDAITGVRL